MAPEVLRNVLEAAMLAAGRALSVDDFVALFEGSSEAPDRDALRAALAELGESLASRPLELVEVASGYRLQVRREYSGWLGGLFAERAPRYSRALLETLALIAYRQPITRGEIEDVRGVAVSTNIIKTLMEREWIRVLGHREVPGRPALYGTTREFLDHFGLKSLEGLPSLAELKDLDQVEPDLFAPLRSGDGAGAGEAGDADETGDPSATADAAHTADQGVAQEETGGDGPPPPHGGDSAGDDEREQAGPDAAEGFDLGPAAAESGAAEPVPAEPAAADDQEETTSDPDAAARGR